MAFCRCCNRSSVMPRPVASRRCPVNCLINMHIRSRRQSGKSASPLIISCINRTSQCSQPIRSGFYHRLADTVIISIINHLIRRIASMITGMRYVPSIPEAISLFIIICPADVTRHAPAYCHILIWLKFLYYRYRPFPFFHHSTYLLPILTFVAIQ